MGRHASHDRPRSCSGRSEGIPRLDITSCNSGYEVSEILGCFRFGSSLRTVDSPIYTSFATLSCISSLAVAPKLPVWNLRPQEYIARRLAPHALANPGPRTVDSFAGQIEDLLNSSFTETARQRLKHAQRRERIAIGLSLLFQVNLFECEVGLYSFEARWSYSGPGLSSYSSGLSIANKNVAKKRC